MTGECRSHSAPTLSPDFFKSMTWISSVVRTRLLRTAMNSFRKGNSLRCSAHQIIVVNSTMLVQ